MTPAHVKQAPSLSAFLIVFNEQENIERCLNSIKWADEIVIVDSYSTDRTVEICRKYTDKIFSRVFSNYSDQKNYALSQITGEWALSLDADEELTETLVHEIRMLLQSGPKHDGYRIHRISHIFRREFHFSGTQDDKPIRLFKKGSGEFSQPIHEFISICGSVGELKGQMNHYTYKDINSYLLRLDRYTTMESEFLATKHSHINALDWLLRPLAMFMKLYAIKQGFRDGFEGFLFCFFSGWYVFIKFVKYREALRRGQACHISSKK